MPRAARIAPGGVIFHVLNRANARSRIFEKDQDYEAFKRVIGEAVERIPVRILAYSIMPNHYLCGAQHKACYVKLGIM